MMGDEPDALSTVTAGAAQGGAADRMFEASSPTDSGAAGNTPDVLGFWTRQLASGALCLSALSVPYPIFEDAGAATTAARGGDVADASAGREGRGVSPAGIADEDLLDWDARIAVPPPREKGAIRARLVYKGRAKPAPVADDDWE